MVVKPVTGTAFEPSPSLQFCIMPMPVKASSLNVSVPESANDEYSNVPMSSGATEEAGGGQMLPLRRNCALSAPLTVTQQDEMYPVCELSSVPGSNEAWISKYLYVL